MSGMNVNGNKKTAAAAKAQKAKQTKKVVKKKQPSIAEALHNFADNNSAAVGKAGFTNLIKKINKDTVISIIQNYDRLYNNDEIKNSTFKDAESIVETILDETGSKESAIREALIGEGKVRGIFTLLLDKAKDAGVDSNAIAKYKAEFTKELDKELKGSRFTRSSAKLDEIIQVVIQAIDNQKILTPTEKKVAVAAVNTKQIDTINIIVNRYNKALKDFNAQMKRDGWAGDVANQLSKIWGSGNTADKVRKDLKIAKKQIDELKAARNKGKAAFEAKFKKIFGVPYNAQNIMAYEKQESTYKEASIRYGIEKQFKSHCSLLLKGQPLKEETTSDMSGMVARRPSGTRVKATKEQVYKREFNNLAKAMGKDGTNTLNQLLEASNANTLEEKYQILQNIAKDIYTNLHKATEKACGGRSFANVEKTYQNSYKAAFGLHNDILKRVTDYNISQEKGAGIVKGATVAAAAIAAGILTGGTGAAAILTISGVAAGATAVTEVSDRMTSGKAIDAAKKGGLKEYAKTVYNDVQWTDVAVQSLVSGAMAAVFAGQSIAVGKFATYTASKLGLSSVGSALMATGATTLSGIAFPLGTEYALTGKITVEGAAFAVVLAVVAGTIQVVKISKMASAAKASAQSEAEAGIEFARKTLGIPDDVELTPEVVKQYRNAKAKALHSDRTVINGASNDLEMALVNDAYKTLTNVLKTGTVTTNEATSKPAQPSTVPTAQGTDEMGLVPMNNSIAPTAPQTAGGILPNIPHEVSDYNIADVIQKYENPDVSGHSTTSELSNGEGTRTDYLVGDGKIGLTIFENNNGMIIGAVEFMYDDGNLIRTIEYPGLNTTGKALREIAGVNAEAQKAQKTKAQASAEPKPLPTVDNPHNIVSIQAPDAVGAKAQQALAGSKYKIATAGYSAPPEGYEDATIYFLRALDINLGTEQTGYITSPTADKGSIDAITTEVAGFEKGRLFYTTAQDYVEYINPENFPTTIDTHAYAQVPKYVLPDATSYSEATAKCSNTFLATGGRNATVSDFVNAVKNCNKAIILENTSLDVPAWGEAKGRVENASKYLVEQIQAVKDGKPLPYPEVGEFTRNFIEENMSTIDNMVRSYKVDEQPESINVAAKQAAEFIKGNSHNPSAKSAKYQALLDEINNCNDLDYLRKNILPKVAEIRNNNQLSQAEEVSLRNMLFQKRTQLQNALPQAAKNIVNSLNPLTPKGQIGIQILFGNNNPTPTTKSTSKTSSSSYTGSSSSSESSKNKHKSGDDYTTKGPNGELTIRSYDYKYTKSPDGTQRLYNRINSNDVLVKEVSPEGKLTVHGEKTHASIENALKAQHGSNVFDIDIKEGGIVEVCRHDETFMGEYKMDTILPNGTVISRGIGKYHEPHLDTERTGKLNVTSSKIKFPDGSVAQRDAAYNFVLYPKDGDSVLVELHRNPDGSFKLLNRLPKDVGIVEKYNKYLDINNPDASRNYYAEIASPEYMDLSNAITKCNTLEELRGLRDRILMLTGQERIDIGFKYNKKFIELRDDLPQAVKDIENNFFRRIFNRDNSGNSNSNAEAIRHSDFINQHPKLFKDTYDSNNTVWRRHDAANMEYSPWKMHLYSVSESDWQKMCQVVIPILQKYDANWKTLGSKHTTEELNGSIQEGKAFTVYPKNNQEMEMIAKALDKAIREAGLVTEDSHIVGDRQMGNSGRLFYRYAYKSGQYKNYIIDLNDAGNRNRYNSLYDANRGEGQYLAKDMTPADDIWLNFDPSNTNSKPGAAPAPKGAIVNTPADAIQQSQKFNNSHNIGVSEVIMDGYKDGGRGLRFDKNGNPINQPTREIIVVDRTRDARLQSMIWEVKRKTHNMSDKEKAAFLQKYVFDICEGKNIQSKNMRAWVNRNVGKEVLLGDIIAEEPPIAVCRHRSLLLKILGDEIGLKVELQRGNFYNNIGGGGGHAWNVVRFNDGTSAIYDAMHNKTSNITPGHVDAYAQMYKTVNNEKLYTNQSRPINKPAVSTPRAQRHEFVSMKKPLLAERGLKEGQMLPQHQEVVMKLDDVVLLGGDYTLKLSEFSHLKDGQSITVGREGDYRIPGDNMHVSRNHLEITRRGNDLILVDNSKNGTRFVSWDIQENETAITETAFDDALDEPDKIIVDKPQNGDADKSAAKINANEGAVIDGSSIKGDFPKDTKVKCKSGTVLLLGAEGQEFPLALEVLDLQEGQTYTVGRLGEIKIPGNYMSVSRQHLEITKQGDSFIVVDKSKYGTRIEVNSAEGAVIDGSSIKGDFPKDTKVKCESDVSLYLGAHEEGCILELNKLNLEEGRTYTVGRLGDIEIPGYYTSVSRLHLEITKQGNNFIVVDKSKYGTRIYN